MSNKNLFASTSLALPSLTDISSAVSNTQDTYIAAQRQIGTYTIRYLSDLYPDITVEEDHADSLMVTDHPVEKGAGNAFIQDNAYKLPAEVTITYGWSPSYRPDASLASQRSATFLNDIYDKLLEIQASRMLFPVRTARRVYENMVLQSITLTTDVYTENVLLVRLTCKEILFATTTTTQAQLTPANQADASKTLGVAPTGPKQTGPAPTFNSKDLMNYPNFIKPFISSDGPLGTLPVAPQLKGGR